MGQLVGLPFPLLLSLFNSSFTCYPWDAQSFSFYFFKQQFPTLSSPLLVSAFLCKFKLGKGLCGRTGPSTEHGAAAGFCSCIPPCVCRSGAVCRDGSWAGDSRVRKGLEGEEKLRSLLQQRGWQARQRIQLQQKWLDSKGLSKQMNSAKKAGGPWRQKSAERWTKTQSCVECGGDGCRRVKCGCGLGAGEEVGARRKTWEEKNTGFHERGKQAW